MITISDYLGYLFNQVIHAKAMADAESVRVAQVYSKDEIMKHFPVPRFRLPELEMDIPIGVSKVALDELRTSLNANELANKSSELLHIVLKTINAQKGFDNTVFDEIKKTLKEAFNRIAGLSTDQKVSFVSQNFGNFVGKVIKTSNTETNTDEVVSLQNSTTKDFMAFIQRKETELQKSKLLDVFITPETFKMQTTESQSNLFRIKAKFVEEGFYMNSITDEKGNKKTIIDFE